MFLLRFSRSLASALALLLASPLFVARTASTALHAQAVAGVGDDAIPLPSRGWRLSLTGIWDQWDRSLSADGRTPLLAALATPSLGSAQLPALRPVEAGLQAMLGGDFALSLGALEARGGVRRASSLLQAEWGITRRVSVGVRVPYVEVVHDADLVLNRTGSGANVGENPGLRSAQNRINNGSVYVQLVQASRALGEELATCTATPSAPGCALISADPAAVQALLNRANAFADAWRSVYGDGGEALGGPMVPHVASEAHAAITTQLAALSSDFSRYGQSSVRTTIPAGATLVYGTSGLQTLAKDSAFGVNADTLDRAFRAGVGDVELEARVLLFDSWRADQRARLSTTRPGVRVLAAAGWRFGTSSSAQAEQPFALATGDGVNALLLRATTDLVWKRWAWLSMSARAVLPQADNAVVRFPGVGLPDAFFTSAPTAVSRQLGRRLDLEIVPRVSLRDNIGLSAALVHRTFASDRYLAEGGASWETPSGSAQFATLGVTYSTLAPYTRGKARVAVEISLLHEVALAASGVTVPSLVRDRLELRVYPGFPRR